MKILRKIKYFIRQIPKIRLIFGLILLILLAWLVIMDIVPSGEITYKYSFSKYSDFITKLHPNDRLLPEASGEQKIIGDPVYFSLRTPRKFEKVRLSLKYKNEADNLPIISVGVLVDKMLWRYLMQPIENKFIDNLAKSWNVIKEDDLLLLQKDPKYSSIKDFLANLPERNRIALYNYDLKNYYYLADYQASVGGTLPASLRGEYQIYTYIKNESLSFTFNFVDLNQNKDTDPIYIMLYDQNNKLLLQKELPDDGVAEITNQKTAERSLLLSSPSLSEGVYKIEVKVNDDILTKTLSTNQSKIAFKNKLWIAEGANNLQLYTDSASVSAQTINPASLQTIKVGADSLELLETYERFSIINHEPVKEISVLKGDLMITGNGVFAFSLSNLVNPAFKQVDHNFVVGDIQYILADYELPIEQDGWQERTVELDLSNAYREDDKNLFIISIPGLSDKDILADYIIISEIKAKVSGRSLREFLQARF
ncbi:MAG: hypothetical protein V1865_00395 [bacterium]